MTTDDRYSLSLTMPKDRLLITDPALFPPKIASRHFEPLSGSGSVPVLESVELFGLQPMQFDSSCDCCGGPIRAGETVMSKGLNMVTSTAKGGGSSQTCIGCVDKRGDWLAWLIMCT